MKHAICGYSDFKHHFSRIPNVADDTAAVKRYACPNRVGSCNRLKPVIQRTSDVQGTKGGVINLGNSRIAKNNSSCPLLLIKRRFHRGLKNLFTLYIPLASRWKVFDSYFSPPVQIAAGTRTRKLILQEQKWKTLNELAQKA